LVAGYEVFLAYRKNTNSGFTAVEWPFRACPIVNIG